MSISVQVYLTHDNPFSFIIRRGSSAVNLVTSNVTRMVIRYGDGASDYIDSDVTGQGAGQPFDWTTDGESGIVKFDFGDQSISPGNYNCYLVIYDVLHPDGQVWPKHFELSVKEAVI